MFRGGLNIQHYYYLFLLEPGHIFRNEKKFKHKYQGANTAQGPRLVRLRDRIQGTPPLPLNRQNVMNNSLSA